MTGATLRLMNSLLRNPSRSWLAAEPGNSAVPLRNFYSKRTRWNAAMPVVSRALFSSSKEGDLA